MASKTLQMFSLFCSVLFLQLHFSAGQSAVQSAYWFPDSGIEAEDIDSTLFTHLFCAFADLDANSNQVTVSSSNSGPFSQFTQTVQQKNPNVKTLLSIGGGNSDTTAFASMASQASSRKSFIDSSIKLARNYGFHGLDLDWEYPETAAHMSNLRLLFNEWRAAVAADAKATGKPALLLTAAVYYAPRVNGVDYPIQAIANGLDWINLMAYDFYDPTRSQVTNSHAALYDPAGQVSGDYGVGAWIKAGLGSKKLVLGLPFYGYAWRLVNANNHGLYAPANGAVGPESGAMGFNQIRNFITQNNAPVVYNATVVTNYCYSGTTWIGYDGTRTVSTKVSYAKQKRLLGYFAWHVAADENWALSKAAKQAWGA
ncbi:class V chitinase-like [Diospyros lotus]|uniref:class V chitinase-like n=1 Tax=Diospyros lotus TaxID=55363 RepID=UPI0022569BC8|nr:class V chitinase-like [Diospyros lotus]